MFRTLLENIFPFELQCKLGCSKHCLDEQRNLIKKLTGEGT